MDGGEAVQKKRMQADLDGEVENEMKKITYYFYCIHSDCTVCFITKDNFLYCFQLFLLFCILERYWYIGPFMKFLAPKMGCRGHFGPQPEFSGWNTELGSTPFADRLGEKDIHFREV